MKEKITRFKLLSKIGELPYDQDLSGPFVEYIEVRLAVPLGHSKISSLIYDN